MTNLKKRRDFLTFAATAAGVASFTAMTVPSRSLANTSLDSNIENLKAIESSLEFATKAQFEEGNIVQTKGYYEANDGGHALYIIKRGTIKEDKGKYHRCNDELYAELIFHDSVNILTFGAKGNAKLEKPENHNDWHDNYQAIVNAINALPDTGGKVIIPNDHRGSIYRIDYGLSINKSNISIIIESGAHLYRFGGNPTHNNQGHTIAFVGKIGTPISNCHIYGGGMVSSQKEKGSIPTENAIGFASVHNFSCTNMIIPESDEKGITAQGNVKNGLISNNRVLRSKSDGIAIEVDAAEDYENSDIILENNIIEYAGHDGIKITSSAKQNSIRIKTLQNHVILAERNAYFFSYCRNLISLGDTCEKANHRGFWFINCDEVDANITSISSGLFGTELKECGIVSLKCTLKNSSLAESNKYDTLRVLDAKNKHIIQPIIKGREHAYDISCYGKNNQSVYIQTPIFSEANSEKKVRNEEGCFIPNIYFLNEKSRAIINNDSSFPNISFADNFIVSSQQGLQLKGFKGNYSEGKKVSLFFTNSNTTLIHSTSSNLRLQSNKNVTPPTGSFLNLEFVNGLWYETQRSF